MIAVQIGWISARQISPVRPNYGLTAENVFYYNAFLGEGMDRDAFKARMTAPLTTFPLSACSGLRRGDFLMAEAICRGMVCLPLYLGLSDEETRCVVGTVDDVLAEFVKS